MLHAFELHRREIASSPRSYRLLQNARLSIHRSSILVACTLAQINADKIRRKRDRDFDKRKLYRCTIRNCVKSQFSGNSTAGHVERIERRALNNRQLDDEFESSTRESLMGLVRRWDHVFLADGLSASGKRLRNFRPKFYNGPRDGKTNRRTRTGNLGGARKFSAEARETRLCRR